jgi:hypothetical protein
MLRHLLSALIFLAGLQLYSQDITDYTRVSLITCGAGNDLYSTFGHTAIHIFNSKSGIDRMYNYGTFDFDTPNFYLKFAQGKLDYQLSVSTIDRFMRSYEYEGRWVYRQELNLTTADAEALYDFLENNALTENKGYRYDFFYDNCSTRPRDVFEKVLGERLKYVGVDRDTVATFREMIDLYLTNHHWSRLGIYLALGIPCDYKAGFREKMFLPDYLMAAFAEAQIEIDGELHDLVKSEGIILPENEAMRSAPTAGITWIFWIFFGICLLANLLGNPDRLRWFDITIFTIAGVLGILVALLWFATDHSATKWNMNLLWALPSWLYGAWLLIRKKTGSRFFKWHALILFFVVVSWMWIPQKLHPALVPVVLALMARSWAWQKKKFTDLKTA